MDIDQITPQTPFFSEMQPNTEIKKTTQAPVSFLTKINNMRKNPSFAVIAIDVALAVFMTTTAVGVAFFGVEKYNQHNEEAEIATFFSLGAVTGSVGLTFASAMNHLLIRNPNSPSNV